MAIAQGIIIGIVFQFHTRLCIAKDSIAREKEPYAVFLNYATEPMVSSSWLINTKISETK